MSTINVFLYAYKNKKLNSIVDVLIEKSSKKNKIFFDVYDKDNEDKKSLYKKYSNLSYTHVFWDNNISGPYCRKMSLNKPFDYFFEIGNLKEIKDCWDDYLIKLEDNCIITTGKNFINMDFIFLNKKNSKMLNELSILKFYGQDLFLYYLLNKNNIKIKYFNDCNINDNTTLNSEYVPFSLYHHYNENISMIKNDIGFNNYENDFNWEDFPKKHFQINDKNYGKLVHNLDNIQSEKFHRPVKVIQRVHE